MTNTEAIQPSGSRKVLRRIGAVLGGLVLVLILDTAIDVVMHATGIYPPWFQPMRTSLWLIAIGYRMIDGTIGGYVAARLAPDRPVAHAFSVGFYRFCFEYSRTSRNLEQRSRVRAEVVSAGTGGCISAVCFAGRFSAGAPTAGPLRSFRPRRRISSGSHGDQRP